MAHNSESLLAAKHTKPDTVDCTHSYDKGLYEALRQLRVSLVISTYGTGQMVSVSADDAKGQCRVSYAKISKPMGMSWQKGTLTIATKSEVYDFRQTPSITLGNGDHYDSLFLPKTSAYTGEIQAHDVCRSEAGTYVVNTSFSCLILLKPDGSQEPVWKPSFISALLPEDRCHLNGLVLKNGAPAFVTALSESDTAHGWRAHKAEGGIIIDVVSGEIIARGLSMPHSPRLHRNELYFINSGVGKLSRLDPASGVVTDVADLPGFGRGLSLIGNYAFVALSKARETAIFGELPITGTGKELQAGVAVIDIRTGERIGLLEFTTGVTELFEVLALPFKSTRIVGPNTDVDSFGTWWLFNNRFVHRDKPKPEQDDQVPNISDLQASA